MRSGTVIQQQISRRFGVYCNFDAYRRSISDHSVGVVTEYQKLKHVCHVHSFFLHSTKLIATCIVSIG